MGVQGLSTLVASHPQIYREVRLRRSRLVIDGCNLLYMLYFTSGLDEVHGGENAAFEDLTEKFVAALRVCEVSPYVLLDGGSDITDQKLETVTRRAQDRIRRAHQAAVGGTNKSILPLFAKLVFLQTLTRLEVPVAQCYGEADQEIAALANEWQCPVLSNDSDFYIYCLPAGLLPVSLFKWQEVERSGSRSIPCQSYRTSSFCIVFNLQPSLLPAFGALAGNDYVKLQRMGSSIKWDQFCPDGHDGRLEGLLCWLKGFKQPTRALEAALGLMGDLSRAKKAAMLQSLRLGMKEYRLPPSSLKRFFIHGVAPAFPAAVAAQVPAWMRLPLTQARLSGDVLDVLLLHRLSLRVLVDHAHWPSACLASRPIRQVMYGLLLGKTKSAVVEERDREGFHLKFIQAEPSERLQVILEALGLTEASLKPLPPQLRLPVAATCYWLRNAQPPPDQALLKALLLGLSNGDAWRRRAASRTRPKLDMAVAHSFNQWQVCLKDSFLLNWLLGCPLPEAQVARLYEGMLVHRLVHMMRTGQSIKSFLKSDRSSERQYRTLLSAVHRVLSATRNEDTAPPQRQKQRQPLDDLTPNLQQLFFQYEDEETETEVRTAAKAQTDLDLALMLSVRTRYRTKERNNRAKNPELARKEECRGWDLF